MRLVTTPPAALTVTQWRWVLLGVKIHQGTKGRRKYFPAFQLKYLELKIKRKISKCPPRLICNSRVDLRLSLTYSQRGCDLHLQCRDRLTRLCNGNIWVGSGFVDCKRGAGWPNICERGAGQSPGDQTYLGEMWFLQHWPDDWTHFGRGQKMTVRGRLSCPGSICIMPDDLQGPTITFKIRIIVFVCIDDRIRRSA